MYLKTLDFHDYTEGTAEQRKQFISNLLKSFDESGFIKLVNHGLREDTLAEVFEWSDRFFHQSLDQKNEISNTIGPNPMRGYTEAGIERVSRLHTDKDIRAMSDAKEHFDQGPAEDTGYPNKWPSQPEFAKFQPLMELFYKRCEVVCLMLIQAIEAGLGIDDGSLLRRCVPSGTDLRLTHYPAISLEEMTSGRTTRIAPHSDFGIITLLFQDGVGGLEVEDRSQPGTFAPASSDNPAEVIVNVGDTLQHWTNGLLTGGVHRVTVPERMKHDIGGILPERYTAAFLFKAERNVPMSALSQFASSDEEKMANMTALEFQQMKNNTLYV